MADYDLVVRGGEVFDGDGGPSRRLDVGIRDGRIAALEPELPRGEEEIDARGRIVTPGFVDIHTHYDGQATWDERLQPSSWHGVTTVVMGNCGVGFAPCREPDRERLIQLMEGVEDIPFPVLAEGLPWNWREFEDYLDGLEGRRFDMDLGTQLPHAALRVFVMGERGARREPATAEDRAAMREIARRAALAGALGFSTSRTLNHRTSTGEPTPTLTAAEDELLEIALGLRDAGRGVLQVVSDFDDLEAEAAMLLRIASRSGRPLSFSLVQSPRHPEGWRRLLSLLDAAEDQGVEMRAQTALRPVGVVLGLDLTVNPFSSSPAWREIKGLPLAGKVSALRDPELRARLLEPLPEGSAGFSASQARRFERLFPLADPPDYEPPPEASVAALAAARGVRPEDLALDLMLEGEGRGLLYLPFLNYADGSLQPAFEMMSHGRTVPGLSDGGAHVGMISDGSFPTTNLSLFCRDRTRGPKLPLERMIRAQTRDTAEAVGLLDRGRLKIGWRADLNVIDFDRLAARRPEVVHDLPAGGRRLIQRATGYEATIVAGEITYREGEATGALPGRLLRSGADGRPRRAAEGDAR